MREPITEQPAPLWVKVSGAAAVAGVVLLAALLALGHGPGQHFTGAGVAEPPVQTPSGQTPAGTTP
jgi:hypothetical protein